MGYRDYGTTLKTLNHYQSENGASVPFFTADKSGIISSIESNNIYYYLHPNQIIENSDKNYERVFSSWFVNQELNNETWNNPGNAFFILDKQENLKCRTEPYPSLSDYIKTECLVCSNLTRYRIKSGWIRHGYENLLNENLPEQSYNTSYDYSEEYKLKNNTNFTPAVRVVKSGVSKKYIICEQYKLKSLLMSINENKYNFLNTKIVISGVKGKISVGWGLKFDGVWSDSKTIVFNKNQGYRNRQYDNRIKSQYPDQEGWMQRVGYSLYNNYYNNPGFMETWVYVRPADRVEGGYYYIPVLDRNEDDTFSNYNIDEVQYYDENGYLAGYKLTGYLIDVKALKLSEEIICKPEN